MHPPVLHGAHRVRQVPERAQAGLAVPQHQEAHHQRHPDAHPAAPAPQPGHREGEQRQGVRDAVLLEVGVDVPNASLMIIENPERLGLSQLHQLRGRVGRGADQSYCILMSGNKLSDDARERLQTMVTTNDGFEISEADLRLRGPGDLMGTQQSGVLQLKIADIVKDAETLKLARSYAQEVLREDPDLNKPEHTGVRHTLAAIFKFKNIWHHIS